jgi:hypothetical protein
MRMSRQLRTPSRCRPWLPGRLLAGLPAATIPVYCPGSGQPATIDPCSAITQRPLAMASRPTS